MRKILVVVLLLVAVGVFAKPPLYANSEPSDTTVVKLETGRNIRYVEVFAPDEDVTLSIWRHNAADDTFTKKYPLEPSGCVQCDSTYTVYAGIPFKLDNLSDVDVAVIKRATATAVEVLMK